MDVSLTDLQIQDRENARRFVAQYVAPWAEQIDQLQATPHEVIRAVKDSGYLGAALPATWGGGDVAAVSYGLITEEFGKVCSSVRSLLTVHNMAAQVISGFGSPAQKALWLPQFCRGEKLLGFALSEPEVGSATHTLQMQAQARRGSFILNGTKKWISYGELADVFLVFANREHAAVALLVERNRPGLVVEPIRDLLGARGSMLATLRFTDVEVPLENQIGPIGAGVRFVANSALDHGRFSVAWGALGILQAALDVCLNYTETRQQGGRKLREYALLQRLLADMLVAYTAARGLCLRSASLRDRADPRTVPETAMAKYFTTQSAITATQSAVNILGANGCSSEYPVSRYLRDATVMGIVEGTNEIHQQVLANYAFQKSYAR